jgi:hypothetical protein
MVFKSYFFLTFLFILGLISHPANAQLEQDLWFNGSVELEQGDIIQGELSYYSDYENGLLQIKVNGRTYSYNANQIIRFNFYDPQLRRDRSFYSLPYSPIGNPNDIMLFFEALYEGAYLSVLSKTEIRTQTRTANNGPFVYRGTYIPSWHNRFRNDSFTILMPYETLYIVSPKSEIQDYNEPTALDRPDVRFKKAQTEELEKLMRDQGPQIQAFLQENKFDLRRRDDMIRTVAYYNELKQKLAKN